MSIPDTTTKEIDMNKIEEIKLAAITSCGGIKEALTLIHSHETRKLAHGSVDAIEQAIRSLAELADESGLEDRMNNHPDYITRSQLEREVDYATVELYGENYVKVMDLYSLFTVADPSQDDLI